MAQIVLNSGSRTQLPIVFNYTPESGSRDVYQLSARVWSTDPETPVGLVLETADGTEVVTAAIFAQTAGEHHSVLGIAAFEMPFTMPMTPEGLPKLDDDGRMHAEPVELKLSALNENTQAEGYMIVVKL